MGSNYRNKQQRKAQSNSPNPKTQPAGSAKPPSSSLAQALRRKDQERAKWAYERAGAAGEGVKEYEIAVQTFSATVLRSGLAVAVSVLERDARRDGPKRLMEDIAACNVPAIPPGETARWPERVRTIPALEDYMLATRELLALITWLRRACRAVRASRENSSNGGGVTDA